MYIDQSAAELRLNVVGGGLDLSQFRLLEAGLISGARLQVRAAIIGASHVIALEPCDAPALHEVLACTDVRAPARTATRLYSGRVRGLSGEVECEPSRQLGYRFRPCAMGERDGQARLAALAARIDRAGDAAQSAEIGLSYTFPIRPGTRRPPRTLVWVGVGPKESQVRVETAHCYPNEQTIVFSETHVAIEREVQEARAERGDG